MNSLFTILLILNLLWTGYLTYLILKKFKSRPSDTPTVSIPSATQIYLSRYNPFQELGGDQSFILVLLNNLQNGVIITSLHAKDTTRIYAKPIKNGQGDGFTLSKEEKVALAKTIKN